MVLLHGARVLVSHLSRLHFGGVSGRRSTAPHTLDRGRWETQHPAEHYAVEPQKTAKAEISQEYLPIVD